MSDIRFLGFCQKSEIVQIEGDEYEQITLYLRESTVLQLLADLEGSLYRVSTQSEAVRDERDLGVGSTLEEVRAAYPSGRLYFLHEEESPQVKYLSGSKVAFVFDANNISSECFLPKGDCELPKDYPVSSLEIYAIELKLD